MSLKEAKEYIIKCGYEDRIMEFKESSATVKDAANVIGCNEGEIAKSLSFYVDDKPILILMAGDNKIDNSKYKQEFHTKAKMIPFEELNDVIGHTAGGICPFGIKENINVYLDESLKKYEIIYPACGNAQSAVKLSINELEKVSKSLKWIDVCKTMNME